MHGKPNGDLCHTLKKRRIDTHTSDDEADFIREPSIEKVRVVKQMRTSAIRGWETNE